MKERLLEGFGARLAELHQARGLWPDELAIAVGVSRRVIAYYEGQSAQPPGRALRVSTDELPGVKPVRDTLSTKTARLLKRLRRIQELARAVVKLVDATLET